MQKSPIRSLWPLTFAQYRKLYLNWTYTSELNKKQDEDKILPDKYYRHTEVPQNNLQKHQRNKPARYYSIHSKKWTQRKELSLKEKIP